MFYETINKIKNGYHHNRLYINAKINKNEFKIIRLFIKLGVIKKLILKKNIYKIYYSYNQNKKTFQIINMYRPSMKKFIKLRVLRNSVLRKNWILILSTNQGVMTSVEAVKKNIGGLIIAKIWF